MFAKIIVLLTFLIVNNSFLFPQTFTFQEGADGYNGCKYILIKNNRNSDPSEDEMYFRYNDYASGRTYNLLYFDLGDMSSWGEVAEATLTLTKSRAGGVYNAKPIHPRRITDPDNLGMWSVGSGGWRQGGNVESRDDTPINGDIKWQNSNPSSPDDLDINCIDGVLVSASTSFTPANDDEGTTYVVDVTDDVEAWRLGAPVQGWALYQEDDANMQYIIATPNFATISYRPLLTVTCNDPLPIELKAFKASIIDKKVKLDWETATEVNNYGFNVERQYQVSSIKYREWENVGFVEGHGNSNSPRHYEFVDNSASFGKYYYRLKQIDIDGSFEYSKIAKVDLGLPIEFDLKQNYPNPFNPTTQIKYNIPLIVKQKQGNGFSSNGDVGENVTLKVYNVLGKEVATLVNKIQKAGTYQVNFNANNLTSGIYFYTLKIGHFIQTKKMILLQ